MHSLPMHAQFDKDKTRTANRLVPRYDIFGMLFFKPQIRPEFLNDWSRTWKKQHYLSKMVDIHEIWLFSMFQT